MKFDTPITIALSKGRIMKDTLPTDDQVFPLIYSDNTEDRFSRITLPDGNAANGGATIDVQDILAHQLEEELKQKYQAQIADEKKKYAGQFAALSRERAEFEEKKKQENELFRERLEKQLREERKNHPDPS